MTSSEKRVWEEGLDFRDDEIWYFPRILWSNKELCEVMESSRDFQRSLGVEETKLINVLAKVKVSFIRLGEVVAH